MIKVSDYIANRLAAHGIRHVFMVTGGGAMHLNDSFGKHPALQYVCCHHEQACAMAAESYARLTRRLAAVNVTTGPGGLNAMNGVFGAWTDSIPMIVVSGQVRYDTTVHSTGLPLRQLGDQEVDIVACVRPITKYAVMVTDPREIRYHLERALYLAESGRPGPTWIDVPMNVQGAMVDPEQLPGFQPDERPIGLPYGDVSAAAGEVYDRLLASARPCLLVGNGVRISGMHADFVRLVDRLGIPVATAWNAHDLLWNAHPCFVGRPGTVGDRAGNFAVQNADFLLVLGSRLNIRQISYGWPNFARAAFKVMVDVDAGELKKPTLSIDLPIHADLRDFVPALATVAERGDAPLTPHRDYLAWCLSRRQAYPVVLPEYRTKPSPVNPYCFVEALFEALAEDEIVVTGDGTACVVTFQAADLKRGQRLYTNSGCASMGYDLPAAIGAAVGSARQRVVCLAGDGSIMMNLQELQTIATHRWPIKIFVVNNEGYHSIRQTQRSYFPSCMVGCGIGSGLSFPDFERVAATFGLPFKRAANHGELHGAIVETLEGDEPRMCEIMLDIEQDFAPKLASRALEDGRMVSSPLEDLSPFLSRDELKSNMIIPMLEE